MTSVTRSASPTKIAFTFESPVPFTSTASGCAFSSTSSRGSRAIVSCPNIVRVVASEKSAVPDVLPDVSSSRSTSVRSLPSMRRICPGYHASTSCRPEVMALSGFRAVGLSALPVTKTTDDGITSANCGCGLNVSNSTSSLSQSTPSRSAKPVSRPPSAFGGPPRPPPNIGLLFGSGFGSRGESDMLNTGSGSSNASTGPPPRTYAKRLSISGSVSVLGITASSTSNFEASISCEGSTSVMSYCFFSSPTICHVGRRRKLAESKPPLTLASVFRMPTVRRSFWLTVVIARVSWYSAAVPRSKKGITTSSKPDATWTPR